MSKSGTSPPVELVVLVASAGGLGSLSIVLGDLPREFPAAVVVQQHLRGRSSVLPSILGDRTPHRVEWALDGQAVAPGRVVVCPPGTNMELKPDGSCSLHTIQQRGERRFDALLTSLASSYGARGVAVVLSGSGRDGANGTVAMKRAGAVVIAESAATAEYPDMPRAAAQSGADLVLPVRDIGRVLADLAWGASPPVPCAAAWVPPLGTGNSPRARAEAAGQRAAELQRRHRDLRAARGATAQTAAIARLRAEESSSRAQRAQKAADRAADDRRNDR
jgi:two-component system, chemotaxis family, protein-glutamate methylesterase/glutaminase